jgi:hypothetical protein
MMGAWSSEPYLLIQDEENSNGQRVSMHRGQAIRLVEMRCRANVQRVNGYQPSVDSNLAANGLRVIGRRFNVFST